MSTYLSRGWAAVGRVPAFARGIDVIRRSGMVDLRRPDRALVALLRLRQLGPIAGAARVAAARDSAAVALVDERGPLTYAELDARSTALARALAAEGLGVNSVIALLARDHRGTVETMIAAGKLGARLLLMNTGFARPQLVDVARREHVNAIIHDAEFTDLVDALDEHVLRVLAWVDETPTNTAPAGAATAGEASSDAATAGAATAGAATAGAATAGEASSDAATAGAATAGAATAGAATAGAATAGEASSGAATAGAATAGETSSDAATAGETSTSAAPADVAPTGATRTDVAPTGAARTDATTAGADATGAGSATADAATTGAHGVGATGAGSAGADAVGAEAGRRSIEELIAGTDDRPLPNPPEPGGLVLLTSGTTGTPKGAPRKIKSPLAVAQFLDRVPLRAGEATVLAAPLFHGVGLSQFLLSFALGSTVVVRRSFDPEATLRAVQDNRATALVLVPTMLRRVLDLGPDVLARYDTTSLRIVFCAGSALPPELGNRATDAFGDVLYNLYGSTEVAVATVATPSDWRAAPGTVGRPPVGCRVALYDDRDRPITTPHVVGRVFVGSVLSFEGYTDGRHKDILDGLLATGDLGHLDDQGRLFIDGRDDDMIVSGGENVFPGEVENLLLEHDAVAEAAVTGVPDDEFGERLRAYLVLRPGARAEAEEIRDYVRANLARYKVPREVVFCAGLPRNATGKLLRDRLTALD